MKKILAIALLLLPFALNAQNESRTGIRFEQFPGWDAAKAKAKQENKYIFVDCFTTWCGPCKKMEQEIYPIDSIGQFYNEHFICIKVQLDSTAADNEWVRTWYADARRLQQENNIYAFPTLLFYSPEGKLVHKSIGASNAPAFSNLARNALDPEKQYYTRLHKFRDGNMDFKDMPDLVSSASRLQDTAAANAVSVQYLLHLLQTPDSLYTIPNLVFLAGHTQHSTDPGFRIFYNNGSRIDSAVRTPGYARTQIEVILQQEEINNALYKDGKPFTLLGGAPDWDKIHQTLKKKYNADYADRVVLWGKILWVEYKKNYQEYCKNVILKVKKYGPYDKFYPYYNLPHHSTLNAVAWDLFQYSTDRNELQLALEWSDEAIKETPTPDASYLDTYANLLYKLGKGQEAVTYEAKAISLAPAAADLKEALDKMKKGEPTWPNQ